MDEKLIDFQLVIDKLNGFSMETLAGRIGVQKKIYLLQLSGLDLGYRFVWHARGPYSPDLAETAQNTWNNRDAVKEEADKYRLDDEALEKIGRIIGLITSPSPLKGDDSSDSGDSSESLWLELLASTHYLRHIGYVPKEGRENKVGLCQSVLKYKPYYTIDQVGKAWDILNGFNLIERKTLEH